MKKFKYLLLICCLFVISLPLFATNIQNNPNLISGKLENGVHYYIFKNKKPENRAVLNLVVKTGSLLENDNEQGIAHFLEHMAFNGTKKYKKNDMIKYLQSIGLDFGGDLNAYTTFDRTVYSLKVPTTTKELDTGIEVLREWASEVTLDSDEINSEKNIVIEEWRLSQGLSQRLGDVHKKALFEGSKYYDRFPIGIPEIIKGANQNLVRGFYDKWYQPQNISIIAVGDFDINTVENAIKKYFSYKGSSKQNLPDQFKLNKLNNKYIVFSDPELRYNTFYITKILDRKIINTEENFKYYIINEIIVNILNSRIYNLTQENNSPFSESLFNSYSLTGDKDIFNGIVIIKNNRLKEGISLFNEFLKSCSTKGFTENELTLEKENITSVVENQLANKDSIKHGIYAENILDFIMYGDSFLGIEKNTALYKKLLKQITLKDINTQLKNIYNENSLYFLTTSDEQKTINDKELKEIIINSEKKTSLKDYSIKKAMLNPIELKVGKILSVQSQKDYTLYNLSNGIEAYVKNTNFDKDKINITLFKKEGSSIDDYKGFVNSLLAPGIIEASGPNNLQPKDIESFMKGKNFSVNSYITDYEQGINITSNKKDLNQALEYMVQLILKPKVDDSVFANNIQQLKESIENRKNSPKAVYRDKINEIYTGKNPRRSPRTLDDLSLLNKKDILNIYKEKFNNFNGYKIIIVGSLDGIDIKSLLEKYFASLPVKNLNQEPKPLKINTPKNNVSENVVKGIDKKATTTLIFPYNSTYGYEEKTLYNAFSHILNIALIEDIREKIGGVYSISSYTSLSPNNYGEDRLIIRYSCDTNRVDEIKKAVLKTLDNLLYNKIEESKINSVIKNYELKYNTNIKENSFWTNYLYQKNTIKNYKLATPEEYKKLLTEKNLWKVNRKAINLKNYIDVTLIPEKESLTNKK